MIGATERARPPFPIDALNALPDEIAALAIRHEPRDTTTTYKEAVRGYCNVNNAHKEACDRQGGLKEIWAKQTFRHEGCLSEKKEQLPAVQKWIGFQYCQRKR